MEFESPWRVEESLMLWKTKSGHVSCSLFDFLWRNICFKRKKME